MHVQMCIFQLKLQWVKVCIMQIKLFYISHITDDLNLIQRLAKW